jgi:hypothetical protein
MSTSKCFTTDGSKMEDKPFVGFASISKVVFTFTAEALAIGETL